jgi:hypothetical protein
MIIFASTNTFFLTDESQSVCCATKIIPPIAVSDVQNHAILSFHIWLAGGPIFVDGWQHCVTSRVPGEMICITIAGRPKVFTKII